MKKKLWIGAATAAVVAAGTFGAVSANASAPAAAPAVAMKKDAASDNLQQSTHLTIEAATEAAQATLEAAEKENQRVSVAVVDRNGNTIVTLRGDGAGPQSYESAVKKAFTAVSWNAPTSELVKRLETAPNLKDIPGTLFLGGGAPVQVKGAPIAGIGVAGAPSGDLDEKFARAGVASLDN
ncbi:MULTISPECIES: GlcG/HbpS family heme-binding protein [Streptomyces]|uniref:Heme-binding protein n=1 Tax=Streptomyces solicathayae TaxID=3081768 RepID=A0ABZ0LW96_9ACTN|nr:heme-binding protein [Streptomyces sp. HUAS YS2]WOX23595.1 heme-binding protein [Streptomyces sp. HUAS YS2]